MSTALQIGLLLPNVSGGNAADGGRRCIQLAARAEELGYDAVWLGDHVVAPAGTDLRYPYANPGAPLGWETEIYDPLVLLSALAQTTERMQIGICTLAVPYRHPLMTAKMLATADQLSSGRVVLGAGTGWAAAEFAALGVPAEHYARRGAVTDDYLRAIKEAWLNTGPAWYRGEFVQFTDVGTFPHPVRTPHIPIWVAGQGAAALQRAVRLGSGVLLPPCPPSRVAAAAAEIERLANLDRRDPAELTLAAVVELTLVPDPANRAGTTLTARPEQLLELLAAYEQAGLQHLVVRLVPEAQDPWEAVAGAVEAFAAQVLPARSGAARP